MKMWQAIAYYAKYLAQGGDSTPPQVENQDTTKSSVTIQSKESSSDGQVVIADADEDIHAKDNAFNKYSDPRYWYQTPDINTIGRVLLQGKENTVFAGAFTNAENELINMETTLSQYKQDLDSGRAVVGTYNIGDKHWMAFKIYKDSANITHVVYIDSLGTPNSDFEKEVSKVFSNSQIRQLDKGIKAQKNGSDCALFALRNMTILADKNANAINKHLSSPTPKDQIEFSTQKDIQGLRVEYAKIYAKETYATTQNIWQDTRKRQALVAAHQDEATDIQNVLAQDISTNGKSTVAVVSSPQESGGYNYLVTINGFKQMSSKEQEEVLKQFSTSLTEKFAHNLDISEKEGTIRFSASALIEGSKYTANLKLKQQQNKAKESNYDPPSLMFLTKEFISALKISDNPEIQLTYGKMLEDSLEHNHELLTEALNQVKALDENALAERLKAIIGENTSLFTMPKELSVAENRYVQHVQQQNDPESTQKFVEELVAARERREENITLLSNGLKVANKDLEAIQGKDPSTASQIKSIIKEYSQDLAQEETNLKEINAKITKHDLGEKVDKLIQEKALAKEKAKKIDNIKIQLAEKRKTEEAIKTLKAKLVDLETEAASIQKLLSANVQKEPEKAEKESSKIKILQEGLELNQEEQTAVKESIQKRSYDLEKISDKMIKDSKQDLAEYIVATKDVEEAEKYMEALKAVPGNTTVVDSQVADVLVKPLAESQRRTSKFIEGHENDLKDAQKLLTKAESEKSQTPQSELESAQQKVKAIQESIQQEKAALEAIKAKIHEYNIGAKVEEYTQAENIKETAALNNDRWLMALKDGHISQELQELQQKTLASTEQHVEKYGKDKNQEITQIFIQSLADDRIVAVESLKENQDELANYRKTHADDEITKLYEEWIARDQANLEKIDKKIAKYELVEEVAKYEESTQAAYIKEAAALNSGLEELQDGHIPQWLQDSQQKAFASAEQYVKKYGTERDQKITQIFIQSLAEERATAAEFIKENQDKLANYRKTHANDGITELREKLISQEQAHLDEINQKIIDYKLVEEVAKYDESIQAKEIKETAAINSRLKELQDGHISQELQQMEFAHAEKYVEKYGTEKDQEITQIFIQSLAEERATAAEFIKENQDKLANYRKTHSVKDDEITKLREKLISQEQAHLDEINQKIIDYKLVEEVAKYEESTQAKAIKETAAINSRLIDLQDGHILQELQESQQMVFASVEKYVEKYGTEKDKEITQLLVQALAEDRTTAAESLKENQDKLANEDHAALKPREELIERVKDHLKEIDKKIAKYKLGEEVAKYEESTQAENIKETAALNARLIALKDGDMPQDFQQTEFAAAEKYVEKYGAEKDQKITQICIQSLAENRITAAESLKKDQDELANYRKTNSVKDDEITKLYEEFIAQDQANLKAIDQKVIDYKLVEEVAEYEESTQAKDIKETEAINSRLIALKDGHTPQWLQDSQQKAFASAEKYIEKYGTEKDQKITQIFIQSLAENRITAAEFIKENQDKLANYRRTHSVNDDEITILREKLINQEQAHLEEINQKIAKYELGKEVTEYEESTHAKEIKVNNSRLKELQDGHISQELQQMEFVHAEKYVEKYGTEKDQEITQIFIQALAAERAATVEFIKENQDKLANEDPDTIKLSEKLKQKQNHLEKIGEKITKYKLDAEVAKYEESTQAKDIKETAAINNRLKELGGGHISQELQESQQMVLANAEKYIKKYGKGTDPVVTQIFIQSLAEEMATAAESLKENQDQLANEDHTATKLGKEANKKIEEYDLGMEVAEYEKSIQAKDIKEMEALNSRLIALQDGHIFQELQQIEAAEKRYAQQQSDSSTQELVEKLVGARERIEEDITRLRDVVLNTVTKHKAEEQQDIIKIATEDLIQKKAHLEKINAKITEHNLTDKVEQYVKEKTATQEKAKKIDNIKGQVAEKRKTEEGIETLKANLIVLQEKAASIEKLLEQGRKSLQEMENQEKEKDKASTNISNMKKKVEAEVEILQLDLKLNNETQEWVVKSIKNKESHLKKISDKMIKESKQDLVEYIVATRDVEEAEKYINAHKPPRVTSGPALASFVPRTGLPLSPFFSLGVGAPRRSQPTPLGLVTMLAMFERAYKVDSRITDVLVEHLAESQKRTQESIERYTYDLKKEKDLLTEAELKVLLLEESQATQKLESARRDVKTLQESIKSFEQFIERENSDLAAIGKKITDHNLTEKVAAYTKAKEVEAAKWREELQKKEEAEKQQKENAQKTEWTLVTANAKADIHAKYNAFNKAKDPLYQFQGTDVNTIGQEIVQNLQNDNVIFVGGLGRGDQGLNVQTLLGKEKQNLQEGQRLVGLYNTGGNHWISFAILKEKGGDIKVVYHDSLGSQRLDFEADIKKVFETATIVQAAPGEITQTEGIKTACGIFGLKDMGILATSDLSTPHKIRFYNPGENNNYQTEVGNAREEYSELYKKGTFKQLKNTLEDGASIRGIVNAHTPEAQKLVDLLKSKNVAAVECRIKAETDDNKVDRYGYHITISAKDENTIKDVFKDVVKDVNQMHIETLGVGQFKVKIVPSMVIDVSLQQEIANNRKQEKPEEITPEQLKKEFAQALNVDKSKLQDTDIHDLTTNPIQNTRTDVLPEMIMEFRTKLVQTVNSLEIRSKQLDKEGQKFQENEFALGKYKTLLSSVSQIAEQAKILTDAAAKLQDVASGRVVMDVTMGDTGELQSKAAKLSKDLGMLAHECNVVIPEAIISLQKQHQASQLQDEINYHNDRIVQRGKISKEITSLTSEFESLELLLKARQEAAELYNDYSEKNSAWKNAKKQVNAAKLKLENAKNDQQRVTKLCDENEITKAQIQFTSKQIKRQETSLREFNNQIEKARELHVTAKSYEQDIAYFRQAAVTNHSKESLEELRARGGQLFDTLAVTIHDKSPQLKLARIVDELIADKEKQIAQKLKEAEKCIETLKPEFQPKQQDLTTSDLDTIIKGAEEEANSNANKIQTNKKELVKLQRHASELTEEIVSIAKVSAVEDAEKSQADKVSNLEEQLQQREKQVTFLDREKSELATQIFDKLAVPLERRNMAIIDLDLDQETLQKQLNTTKRKLSAANSKLESYGNTDAQDIQELGQALTKLADVTPATPRVTFDASAATQALTSLEKIVKTPMQPTLETQLPTKTSKSPPIPLEQSSAKEDTPVQQVPLESHHPSLAEELELAQLQNIYHSKEVWEQQKKPIALVKQLEDAESRVEVIKISAEEGTLHYLEDYAREHNKLKASSEGDKDASGNFNDYLKAKLGSKYAEDRIIVAEITGNIGFNPQYKGIDEEYDKEYDKDIKINLEGVDLTGSRLSNVAVFKSLKGTIFRDCMLENVTLHGCDLSNSDFRGAKLHEIAFEGYGDKDAVKNGFLDSLKLDYNDEKAVQDKNVFRVTKFTDERFQKERKIRRDVEDLAEKEINAFRKEKLKGQSWSTWAGSFLYTTEEQDKLNRQIASGIKEIQHKYKQELEKRLSEHEKQYIIDLSTAIHDPTYIPQDKQRAEAKKVIFSVTAQDLQEYAQYIQSGKKDITFKEISFNEYIAQKEENEKIIAELKKDSGNQEIITVASFKEGSVIQDMDLAGLDLSGVNFANAQIGKCKFDGADLAGVCFENVTFGEKVSFIESVLPDASFVGATGKNVNFNKALMPRARMMRSDLEGANFKDALLYAADLTGSNLEKANLTGVYAKNAYLNQTNLRSVDARYADMTKASLSKAIFEGSDFSYAKLTEATMSEISAKEANFTEAILENAKMQFADLRKAVLTDIKAKGLNLSNADLEETNLKLAKLNEAIMDNVNAMYANFEAAVLNDVKARQVDFSYAVMDQMKGVRLDISHSILKETRLRNANLTEAVMENVKAFKTDFNKAVLEGVNAQFAEMIRCDFAEANAKNMDIRNANVMKSNFKETDCTGMQFNENTLLLDAKLQEAIGGDALKGLRALQEKQEKLNAGIFGVSKYGQCENNIDGTNDRFQCQRIGAAVLSTVLAGGTGFVLGGPFAGMASAVASGLISDRALLAIKDGYFKDQGYINNGLGDKLAELGAVAIASGVGSLERGVQSIPAAIALATATGLISPATVGLAVGGTISTVAGIKMLKDGFTEDSKVKKAIGATLGIVGATAATVGLGSISQGINVATGTVLLGMGYGGVEGGVFAYQQLRDFDKEKSTGMTPEKIYGLSVEKGKNALNMLIPTKEKLIATGVGVAVGVAAPMLLPIGALAAVTLASTLAPVGGSLGYLYGDKAVKVFTGKTEETTDKTKDNVPVESTEKTITAAEQYVQAYGKGDNQAITQIFVKELVADRQETTKSIKALQNILDAEKVKQQNLDKTEQATIIKRYEKEINQKKFDLGKIDEKIQKHELVAEAAEYTKATSSDEAVSTGWLDRLGFMYKSFITQPYYSFLSPTQDKTIIGESPITEAEKLVAEHGKASNPEKTLTLVKKLAEDREEIIKSIRVSENELQANKQPEGQEIRDDIEKAIGQKIAELGKIDAKIRVYDLGTEVVSYAQAKKVEQLYEAQKKQEAEAEKFVAEHGKGKDSTITHTVVKNLARDKEEITKSITVLENELTAYKEPKADQQQETQEIRDEKIKKYEETIAQKKAELGKIDDKISEYKLTEEVAKYNQEVAQLHEEQQKPQTIDLDRRLKELLSDSLISQELQQMEFAHAEQFVQTYGRDQDKEITQTFIKGQLVKKRKAEEAIDTLKATLGDLEKEAASFRQLLEKKEKNPAQDEEEKTEKSIAILKKGLELNKVKQAKVAESIKEKEKYLEEISEKMMKEYNIDLVEHIAATKDVREAEKYMEAHKAAQKVEAPDSRITDVLVEHLAESQKRTSEFIQGETYYLKDAQKLLTKAKLKVILLEEKQATPSELKSAQQQVEKIQDSITLYDQSITEGEAALKAIKKNITEHYLSEQVVAYTKAKEVEVAKWREELQKKEEAEKQNKKEKTGEERVAELRVLLPDPPKDALQNSKIMQNLQSEYTKGDLLSSNARLSEKISLVGPEKENKFSLEKALEAANGQKLAEIERTISATQQAPKPQDIHTSPSDQQQSQTKGKVTLMAEANHRTDHKENIDKLISKIQGKSIKSGTVIYIERKEDGRNLGMRDVKLLADIIQHNEKADSTNKIKLPDSIANSPIYQDALLYNTARAHGIIVRGAEAKGLTSQKKEDVKAHNKEREAKIIKNIMKTVNEGKNVICLVGSAHIKGLNEGLEREYNKAKKTIFDKVLKQLTAKETHELRKGLQRAHSADSPNSNPTTKNKKKSGPDANSRQV